MFFRTCIGQGGPAPRTACSSSCPFATQSSSGDARRREVQSRSQSVVCWAAEGKREAKRFTLHLVSTHPFVLLLAAVLGPARGVEDSFNALG